MKHSKREKHEARALAWARRDTRARAAVATIAACPLPELAIPPDFVGVYAEDRARRIALADELEELSTTGRKADAPARGVDPFAVAWARVAAVLLVDARATA